ncbi:YbaY family lipoprotein [Pseudomonas sp. DWP3-1-2]|uniref:YbaY family lipoprotein n=1 Tax=Pseudomonas sp. DWP3-1-2 TaxID=2804645 RepID=UPI003CF1FA10
MTLRPFILLGLVGLLAACSSNDAAKPSPTKAVTAPTTKAPDGPGPLQPFQRELSGQLLGVPAGAEVELALLVIDAQGRPQKLLTSTKLAGNNQSLPFQLRFNPEAFPVGARVELRGRASKSGQLILHLPSVQIQQPTTQALGALQFEPAP